MQNVTLQRVPASRATSLLITSAFIAIPTTTAYAVTLEDARDFVTSSHWVSFGVGCLVGAVTGGLLMGVVASRKRRNAVQSSDEAEIASPSNETRPAVSETGVLPTIDDKVDDKAVVGVDDKVDAAADDEMADDRRVDDKEEAEEKETDGKETDDGFSVPLVDSQAPVEAPEATQNTEADQVKHMRKKEEKPSEDASSTGAREKYPTIDRGEVREDDAPTFAPSPYLVKRQRENARRFNPEVRAAIINRRLPRFDESLYPDTTDIMAHDGDMFETAMRAMEDSLMHPETYFDHGPAFASDYAPGPAPNGFDASAYVESIMQDELERSRSHHAQRFSRVHLTVYDGTGTGDLDSTHKHRQYRPRHLRAASREA